MKWGKQRWKPYACCYARSLSVHTILIFSVFVCALSLFFHFNVRFFLLLFLPMLRKSFQSDLQPLNFLGELRWILKIIKCRAALKKIKEKSKLNGPNQKTSYCSTSCDAEENIYVFSLSLSGCIDAISFKWSSSNEECVIAWIGSHCIHININSLSMQLIIHTYNTHTSPFDIIQFVLSVLCCCVFFFRV